MAEETETLADSLEPTAVYHGSYSSDDIRLRIGNGGAGQSGLVGALANAFIDYMVSTGEQPFAVGWYLGDTTATLDNIAKGLIDVGITYNEAAEEQSIESGASIRTEYGFRDHFLLVGPKANPANLVVNSDSVNTMFSKIISSGDKSINDALPTRFLSRFDKSATNIKESELFVNLGHVPWAFPYSLWYHQYPRFPHEALSAAALLQEYTLTDRGTLLSAPTTVQDSVVVYIAGGDTDPNDPLLNPAHVLLAAQASDLALANKFIDWMISLGQIVIEDFEVAGQSLYSPAP